MQHSGNASSMAVELRHATPADGPQLAELHHSAVAHGYAHIFPAGSGPGTPTELTAEWAKVLAAPDAVVIVAQTDRVIVGSVALTPEPAVSSGLLLKRLHVAPLLWGTGIGSSLHDAAVAEAFRRGHGSISLWVLEQNLRARKMYERRGWKLVTPMQTLPNDPPEIVDVLYDKVLGPLSYESVSTWKQPCPAPVSAYRTTLVDAVAQKISALGEGRLRIAIDGYTASGKTSFGHELALAVRLLGRPTLRASLDDFKKPWRDSIAKGYDRSSGHGYYRNAPDFVSARDLLLTPAGPDGSGNVVLCAHDPLTGMDHRNVVVVAPADAVLIVDSVFAFRPEYDEYWDLRIWLDIAEELSLERGIDRDGDREGAAQAEQLHRNRYHASEQIYIDEVDPVSRADIVIDNSDFANPTMTCR